MHLKGQGNSLDGAIAIDDERPSSDLLLTVTPIFLQNPDRHCSPEVSWECQSAGNDGDDPHLVDGLENR